jgi:hypothetical protein
MMPKETASQQNQGKVAHKETRKKMRMISQITKTREANFLAMKIKEM